MGKKSSQSSPMKISKHEKKPQLNSLTKILRPKVYITDTSNFKRLVQQLTGNGQHPPLESSPPPPQPLPPTSLPLSPPSWEFEVPFVDDTNYPDFYQHNLAYQENAIDVSFGTSSSCFTASMEASPDLSLTAASLNRVMGESEKMEFYKGLESMLMEMDSGSSDYDACYNEMFLQQDQVCVYDYDLSSFV